MNEAELAAALRPVLTRVDYLMRRHVPSDVVSLAQGSVLTTLLDHGPLRMGELADRERVRMPTATNLVLRLERTGLVAREPDPDDRRAVLVDITVDGRRRLAQLIADRNNLLAGLLAQLDPAQQQALQNAVPALASLLDLEIPTTESR